MNLKLRYLSTNKLASFPFDIAEDTARFQQSVIDGEKGYFDTIEKKFITRRLLDSLMDVIVPEKNYFSVPADLKITQSINRIRKNLTVYQKNPSDSYAQIFLRYVSNRFLSSQTDLDIDAAILYVDIVGSTAHATKLSSEYLSSLIRLFSQEMSILISKHAGFILKYAGDAVIAYFPHLQEIGNVAENAVRCGLDMNTIIKQAINATVSNFGMPPIQIRVSIDYGKNKIVFLGTEPDLIGHTITLASKMTPFARPDQIVIGENVHKEISAQLADKFVRHEDKSWSYTDPQTGERYPIYVSKTEVE